MPLDKFTMQQNYYSKINLFIASSEKCFRGHRMPLTLNLHS